MLIGVVFKLVLFGDRVRRNGRPVTILRRGKGQLHTSHGSLTPGDMVDTRLKRDNKRVIIKRNHIVVESLASPGTERGNTGEKGKEGLRMVPESSG
jgi:hypothetical protein